MSGRFKTLQKENREWLRELRSHTKARKDYCAGGESRELSMQHTAVDSARSFVGKCAQIIAVQHAVEPVEEREGEREGLNVIIRTN